MAPASAIILAAATSRSMVVAPSTAISFSFCKIRQTSRPLRRIFSNSAAVLRTIIGFYRLANLLVHQLRRIVTGIHLDYLALQVAQLIHLGWMESDVVQGPAARALAASGRTGNNYIVINREMNHHLADAAPACAGTRPTKNPGLSQI